LKRTVRSTLPNSVLTSNKVGRRQAALNFMVCTVDISDTYDGFHYKVFCPYCKHEDEITEHGGFHSELENDGISYDYFCSFCHEHFDLIVERPLTKLVARLNNETVR